MHLTPNGGVAIRFKILWNRGKMQFPQLATNAGLMSTRVQFRVGVASSRLPSTGYIRPELMSKAGPEHVEGSSSQASHDICKLRI